MKSEHSSNVNSSKNEFGFWLYLMTDAALFATFFAVYAVLRKNSYGGPTESELFDMKFVLAETLILLISSLTSGIALLYAKAGLKRKSVILLSVTLLLGAVFLTMEMTEFMNLVKNGESWRQSGFLSAFFALVGLHGLHILFGIIWGYIMLMLVLKRGLIDSTIRKFSLFSLYWHFLDIVWIFIFTFVYSMGVLS